MKGGIQLDYIRQINAFENLNEYNEIGPGAQLLWYKLMRVANLSGWQNELSISNTKLQSMTKTSEKTLINNRNQLIQNGLLQYKKRGRTKAGIYILTDLTGNFTANPTVNNLTTGNIPVNTTVDSTVNTKVIPSVDCSVDTSAYINKTKLNKTNKEDEEDMGVYEFIQKSWGKPPTGILQGALGPWIRDWGSEMILFAFQSAYENSVEMHGLKKYVDKIFATWKSNNVSTLQDAIKAKEDWEAKKNQKTFPNSRAKRHVTRKEPEPKWLADYNEQERLRKEREAHQYDDVPF